MNPSQITLVRTLLNQAGLLEFKEDIVSSHTEGRTVSLKECDLAETQAIVKYLKTYLGQTDDGPEKMRRKIISKAHEMHWKRKDGRIDMERLNGWMINYGQYHKKLDDLSITELPATLTQFDKVLKSFLKGI
jgi:pyruvate carboxylase